MFEHLYEHRVELEAFQEHPQERRQEEVVKRDGNQAADQLNAGFIDAENEDQLGNNQTGAEIFVDRIAQRFQASVMMMMIKDKQKFIRKID